MRARWRRELDQAERAPIDLMEALKKSLKASQIIRGSKVRRIDEPYVVLHVREIDTEGTGNNGTPKALCFNSFGAGKWMLLADLEMVP